MIKEVESEKEIEQVHKKAVEIWNQHFVPIIGQKQVDYMLDLFLSKEAIKKAIQVEAYHFYQIIEKEMIGFFSKKKMKIAFF